MKPNPARENKKEWVFQKGTVITITVADKATEGKKFVTAFRSRD
jgi:hypothetical protein